MQSVPLSRIARATLALALASAPFLADAQTAYSPPVGGMVVTLNAGTGGALKITSFSPALRLPVGSNFVGKVYGTFTSVSDSGATGILTDTSAGWSATALAQTGAPYFVRIRSGSAAGSWWQIASNDATSVTVSANRGFTPAASGVAAGDRYEIVPADTLQTLLGSVATAGGGTSAAVADAVRIHDGVSWKEFYYNTANSQWREGALPVNRNTFVIRPDTGVLYVRRGSSNLQLVLLGNVSTGAERIAVGATGVSVIGSVFPTARVFGQLGIQNASGFVRNSGTLSAADKVNHFDGVSWRSYNYSVANSRWQELIVDKTNAVLPFGVPLVIERGTGATSNFWVTLTPPYSL
jgi:uncharacterized protein (TIGR02597 family)